MRPRTSALLAVGTILVVLAACERPDQNAASDPTTETVVAELVDASIAQRSTNAEPTTPTTRHAESAESAQSAQLAETADSVTEDPAAAAADLNTEELEQVIADLDALLNDLSNSFNQTEGDLQP